MKMNLLRFLSVGNSLTRGTSEPSPYRLLPENRLPNFSKGQKPVFSTSTRVVPSVQPELFSAGPADSAGDKGLDPGTLPPSVSDQMPTVSARAGEAREISKPRPPLVVGGQFGNGQPTPVPERRLESRGGDREGTGVWRRWFVRGNNRLETRQPGKAESILKEVRVVRNELNESDLEFVTARSGVLNAPAAGSSGAGVQQTEFVRPKPSPEVRTSISISTGSGGQAGWGRFVGRMFLSGGGRTLAK